MADWTYTTDPDYDAKPAKPQQDKWTYEDPSAIPVSSEPVRTKQGTEVTKQAPKMDLGDRFSKAYQESVQYSLPGVTARKIADWRDDYKKQIQENYTFKTPEQRKQLKAMGYRTPAEFYEAESDKEVSRRQRMVRDKYEEEFAKDPAFRPDESFADDVLSGRWAASTGGTLASAIDPTLMINPFAKLAGPVGAAARVGAQGVVGAVTSVGTQIADLADDVADEFSAQQVAWEAAANAGLQGIGEGLGALYKTFTRGPNSPSLTDEAELVEFDSNPFLEGREDGLVYDNRTGQLANEFGYENGKLAGGRFEEAVQAGTADDIMLSLEGSEHTVDSEAVQAFVRARDEAARAAEAAAATKELADAARLSDAEVGMNIDRMIKDGVPEEEIRAFAKTQGRDYIPGDPNKATVVPAEEPTPTGNIANDNTPETQLAEALAVPEPTPVRAPKIQAEVEKLTANWKNKPDFNVIERLEDLPDDVRQGLIDDGVDDRALGFVDVDGTVNLIGANIKNPADVVAITFHEALGHYGLSQKFQGKLDGMMELLYKSNPTVRDAADGLKEKYGDIYAEDVSPTARLVEEVLAAESEGGKIDASVYQKVKAVIKQYIRDLGLDLDVSDAEVRAILAMAHDKVVNGEKVSQTVDGRRYMTTWHGSPHDFDEFDHSKMGTGEGQQVFGYGTYLTETERVAKGYRDRLSPKSQPSWSGVKSNYVNTRNNIEAFFTQKGLSEEQIGAVNSYVTEVGGDPAIIDLDLDEYIARVYRDPQSVVARREKEALLPAWKDLKEKFKVEQSKGKVYEVEIPDNASWLKWDEPLSAQQDNSDLLRRAGVSVADADEWELLWRNANNAELTANTLEGKLSYMDPRAPDYRATVREYEAAKAELASAEKEIAESLSENMTGQQAYEKLVDHFGGGIQKKGAKLASEFLHEAGIAGNKYLDGMSRSDGSGSYNYVVFNDKTPKIKNKYMLRDKGESRGKVGGINLDKLKSTRDIDAVIRQAAQKIKPTERVTHENTRAYAKSLKMTREELLELEPNLDEGKLLAANQLLVTSANKVDRLAKAIDSGGNNDAALAKFLEAFAQHVAIQEKVSNLDSHAGRLLNSLKLMRGGARGNAAQLRFMIDNLNNPSLDSPEAIKELASLLVKHGDDYKARHQLMKDAVKPSAGDYVLAAWKNALLSDPGTQFVNILGQISSVGLDTVSVAAAAIGGQGKRFTGGERVPARELVSRMGGLLGAFKLWDSYKTPTGQRRFKVGETWVNTGKAFRHGSRDNTKKTGGKGFLFRGPASIIDTPVRSLAAMDEFFRNVVQSMNVYGLTMRQAVNEGHKGTDLAKRLEELRKDIPPAIQKQAAEDTRILQLVDDDSELAKSWKKWLIRKPTTPPPVKFLKALSETATPFVTTLDRLFAMSLRYGGPTAVLDRVWKEEFKAGGSRRDVALGKLAVGGAISGLIYDWALSDDLTGDGPSDWRKREELMAGGWRPNSVKIGDEYISIRGLDPIATNVKIIATMVDRIKYDETPMNVKEYVEEAGKVVQSLASILTDSHWTAGLMTLAEARGEGPMGESKLRNWAAGLAGSVIPTVVRNATSDGTIKNTSGDGSTMDAITGRVISGVRPQDFPTQYDVYGRERVKGDDVGPNWLSRAEKSPLDTDEAVVELQRLAKGKKVLVGPVQRNDIAAAIAKMEGVERKATAEELETYQYLSGQYILESVRAEMQTEEWKKMDDEERKATVKDIMKDMRKAAREELFPAEEEE